MPTLYDKITTLRGLGPVAARALLQAGVKTVRDLLSYLPYRYEDFSQRKRVNALLAGDTVTVFVEVVSVRARPSFKSRVMVTEATVRDETGTLTVKWFNQPFLAKTFKPGMRLALAGTVDARKGLVLVNPRYERVGEEAPLHTGRIIPLYPRSSSLGEKRLRSALAQVIPLADRLEDPLPAQILDAEGLLPLGTAMRHIHFPERMKDVDAAVSRLKFDELFLHQLFFARVRAARQEGSAYQIPVDEVALRAFVSRLPFTLTAEQKRAAWEVIQDLSHEHPMNRLLEGDVGSGKTVVAAMAICSVLEAGKEAVYLAPTEILAEQQYKNLRRFLPDADVILLTRSRCLLRDEKVSRPRVAEIFHTRGPFVVVSTHAILEDAWDTPLLALVVVDEQHRFGVRDRHRLLARYDIAPHLLSMTATPIPRSLALTVHGDLDISLIKELPKGRRPVMTRLVTDRDEGVMMRKVREEIDVGHVVYVVCPLIDPSDKLGVASVAETASRLAAGSLRGVKIGQLHGRMKTEEKEEVMEAFRSGHTPVLVATSVVEVGMDVPSATIMVVEAAERFGLAQLHQLRGRVGRSDALSYCFLRTSGAQSAASKERLGAMVRCQNGFELAEMDLKFRGPGNLFGDAQSGLPDFQLATLADVSIMKSARDWATRLLAEDPELLVYPTLREHLNDALADIHLE
ncbi:ATP-dependent DNA helicase RecG [Candidatus Uhrbacteria bacterium]|nr:ATP-dependent DNA helicase RecG [Candidatus Uhrbacteria bacterium]